MTRSKDNAPHSYKAPSIIPVNPLIRSYNEADGFSAATRWSYASACVDLLSRALNGLIWVYTHTIGGPLASYILSRVENFIADPDKCSLLSAVLFTMGTLVVSLQNLSFFVDKDIRLNLGTNARMFWTCDRYNWYASRGPANERLVWSSLIGALSSSSSALVVMSMLALMMTSVAIEKGKFARGGVLLLIMNIISNALLFQPSAGSTCLIVQGNGVSTIRLFENQRFIYWGASMPIIIVMLASEAGLKGSFIVCAWFAQLVAVICGAVAYLQMNNRSFFVPFSVISGCSYFFASLILLKSLSRSGTGLIESLRIIRAGITKKKSVAQTDKQELVKLCVSSKNSIYVVKSEQKDNDRKSDNINRAIVIATTKLIAPAFFAVWLCFPLLLVLSGINLFEPAMEIVLFSVLEIVTIILFSCYCILEKSARTDDIVAEQLVSVSHHKELFDAGKTAKQGFMRLVFHELRIPLNALSLGLDDVFANIGQLQKLECHRETQPHLPPQQEHRVIVRDMVISTEILIENVVAMTRLLDRFLDIESSLTEGGRIDLVKSTFSPVDMARESMRLITSPAGLKRVSLDLVVHKDIPSVISGDENRLKQVLNNLLSNALKFTKNDSQILVRLTICQAVLDDTTSNNEVTSHKAAGDKDSVLQRFLTSTFGASSSLFPAGESSMLSTSAAVGLDILLSSFKGSSKIAPASEPVDGIKHTMLDQNDASFSGFAKEEAEGDLDSTLSISIALEQQQNKKEKQQVIKFIRFDIVDSGPGIADDDKIDLFKPYSEPIKGGGSIGLSICKRIIELSGGFMGVENNVALKGTGLLNSETLNSCGSTFFFTVPVDAINSKEKLSGQEWRLFEESEMILSDSITGGFNDLTGARSHLQPEIQMTTLAANLIEGGASSVQPLNGRVDSSTHRTRGGKRGIESPPMFKRQGKHASQKHSEEKQPAVLHVSMPSSSSTSLVDRYGKTSSSTFAFESPKHRPHLGTGRLDVFPPPFPSSTNGFLTASPSSTLEVKISHFDQRSTLPAVSSGPLRHSNPHSLLASINEVNKPLSAVNLAASDKEDDDQDTAAQLRTCLLVDSVESNRTFLRRLLIRRGVSLVHCVSSGEEALSLFRELSQSERNDVQVCFIEYESRPPRLNGAELTARLRSEPLLISCPIIGITESGLEDARRKLQTAGASAVIVAPIRADALEYSLRHFNLTFAS